MQSIRAILVLVAALSLIQYLNQGAVSWPMDALHKIVAIVSDYAGRSGAGWRRASEKIEELGAAREGKSLPEFNMLGRAVRISDGDTLSLLDESNTQHTIRLHGIDAPERGQPHGDQARESLSKLVGGKTLGIVVTDTDQYGRLIATLYLGDININVAMVESGHAWWYRKSARYNRLLATTEQQARDQKQGLWSDPSPVPPWDWRRGAR